MARRKPKISVEKEKAASRNPSPLSRAYRVAQEASRLGFDWPSIADVFRKVDEEVKELREAVALKRRSKIREEIGDLLFVLVNVARFLKVDPEESLNRAVEKFILRFGYIEDSLRKKGRSFSQSDLDEMDHLWEEAKKNDEP